MKFSTNKNTNEETVNSIIEAGFKSYINGEDQDSYYYFIKSFYQVDNTNIELKLLIAKKCLELLSASPEVDKPYAVFLNYINNRDNVLKYIEQNQNWQTLEKAIELEKSFLNKISPRNKLNLNVQGAESVVKTNPSPTKLLDSSSINSEITSEDKTLSVQENIVIEDIDSLSTKLLDLSIITSEQSLEDKTLIVQEDKTIPDIGPSLTKQVDSSKNLPEDKIEQTIKITNVDNKIQEKVKTTPIPVAPQKPAKREKTSSKKQKLKNKKVSQKSSEKDNDLAIIEEFRKQNALEFPALTPTINQQQAICDITKPTSKETSNIPVYLYSAKEALEILPSLKYFATEILHLNQILPSNFLNFGNFTISKSITNFLPAAVYALSYKKSFEFLFNKVDDSVINVSTALFYLNYNLETILKPFIGTENKVQECALKAGISVFSFSSNIKNNHILGIKKTNIGDSLYLSKTLIDYGYCMGTIKPFASLSNSYFVKAIPYAVDFLVGKNLYNYFQTQNSAMGLDYSLTTNKIYVLKQAGIIISSVAAIDYITKATTSLIENELYKILDLVGINDKYISSEK
jgi:hypothetical protein